MSLDGLAGSSGGSSGTRSSGAMAGVSLFTQSIPDVVWTLVHNLGRAPVFVYALNSAGSPIDPDVQSPSDDTTVLNFNVPVSGRAMVG